MLVRFGVLCAAIMGAVLLFGHAPARAQANACNVDDLRCRIEQLEARLNALDAKPAPAPAAPAAAAPVAAYVPLPPTEVVSARRVCRTNCMDEANDVCVEKGFAGGKVKLWDRPKIGPVQLVAATCTRR